MPIGKYPSRVITQSTAKGELMVYLEWFQGAELVAALLTCLEVSVKRVRLGVKKAELI